MASTISRSVALCWLSVAAASCAAPMAHRPNYVAQPELLSEGGLVQIKDASGYLSYQTPTAKDLPGFLFVRRVRGEVCQNNLQLSSQLVGMHAGAALEGAQALDMLWGNASVAQAVRDALQGAPSDAALYDLTLDLQQISVFGVFFRRQCLVVSGSMGLPRAQGASTGPEPEASPEKAKSKHDDAVLAPEGHRVPKHPRDALPLAPIPQHGFGTPKTRANRGPEGNRGRGKSHKKHEARTKTRHGHKAHSDGWPRHGR